MRNFFQSLKTLFPGLAAIAVGVSLLAAPAWTQDRDTQSTSQSRSSPDPQTGRNLSLAYDYHELATLYIKKGEMDKAVGEARQMLQLRLPTEYESFVVKSLVIIADRIGEGRRFDLAQALLDETLKTLEVIGNRVIILKTRARLYRIAGADDKAIESFRQALELERKN